MRGRLQNRYLGVQDRGDTREPVLKGNILESLRSVPCLGIGHPIGVELPDFRRTGDQPAMPLSSSALSGDNTRVSCDSGDPVKRPVVSTRVSVCFRGYSQMHCSSLQPRRSASITIRAVRQLHGPSVSHAPSRAGTRPSCQQALLPSGCSPSSPSLIPNFRFVTSPC